MRAAAHSARGPLAVAFPRHHGAMRLTAENAGHARPRRSEQYRCKLRAKWTALGAQLVKFINMPLTNIGAWRSAHTALRGGPACTHGLGQQPS